MIIGSTILYSKTFLLIFGQAFLVHEIINKMIRVCQKFGNFLNVYIFVYHFVPSVNSCNWQGQNSTSTCCARYLVSKLRFYPSPWWITEEKIEKTMLWTCLLPRWDSTLHHDEWVTEEKREKTKFWTCIYEWGKRIEKREERKISRSSRVWRLNDENKRERAGENFGKKDKIQKVKLGKKLGSFTFSFILYS